MKIAERIRKLAWLSVSGLLAIVLGGFGMARSVPAAMTPPPNALVRWRDADHDWLLVVDAQAGQLVVYDAADGRPLRRLTVAQGLDDVDALTVRDGRLIVVRDGGRLDELQLPRLRWVASTAR